jgi:hypothetical protein
LVVMAPSGTGLTVEKIARTDAYMPREEPHMNTLRSVQLFYYRIWNEGDTAAAPELLAADFSFRGSLGPELRPREPFCEYVRAVRAALQGYGCDILDCVTEGPKAFAKMRFFGKHVGSFRSFAPTGRPVEWLGAALFFVLKIHTSPNSGSSEI